MANRIVLTADRTLMSTYNGSMFIGFAACFPRVLPAPVYNRLFCPTKPRSDGLADAAPGGLRKIEAALVGAGISRDDIVVAHPDRLDKIVNEDTRIIGVTTSDPLGLGPASSTFSSLIKKEPYTAHYFNALMTSDAVRRSKARIIVGGPGAWQLADESSRTRFGIDTVVEGEGETLAPQLFMDALDGKQLPSTISGGVVQIDQIPSILGATINGTVEISRGCGRGCEFCNPNMRQVRHLPLDSILHEVKVNLTYKNKITLHAEDVLRYKAKGMTPDHEKVRELFSEVTKLTPKVGMSHFAISSALSEPRAVEEISHALGADGKRAHVYGQTGIETGSPELVSKHMKGKAKPFTPEKWPEVVREGFKLLSDNNWIPCGTLVMGMPGEKARDVSMTLDLIRDLREYKSFIVPLFFVPLGNLKEDEFFRPKAMLPEHWILFGECIEHDFEWITVLMDELFSQNRLGIAKSAGYRLAAWYMKRRLKPYVDIMKEGRSPMDETEDIGNSPPDNASGRATA